jgi:ABC-type multidrug transport system fused ATPase/permease subunit
VAVVASAVVSLAQLAFPWLLKGIVDLALARGGHRAHRTHWLTAVLPSVGSPVVWLGGAFVVLSLVLALSEYWQRLAVSRFVVPTIDDARVGIFTRLISSSSPEDLARDPGDVLTRVVGDSARLRVGLKGLLTHLLQHGLFILGVCVVLTAVDVRLGMVYLLGLLVALTVAGRGAVRTASMARRARRRESKHAAQNLAAAREPGVALVVKDPDRDRPVAAITQIKGLTACAVQGVLALTACAVLLLAVHFAASGQLQAGHVALVSAYLLMLNYPTTRVGRQITRLGPQITSAERLARLAEPPPRPAVEPVVPTALEPVVPTAVLTAVPTVEQPREQLACLAERAPEPAVLP